MAADFDEPVFDEEFVRSAAFREPSARERARPPSRTERRRARRAARPSGGRRFRRRPGRREPSHRRAVVQLIGGVLVLFAISFGLWWWNSAPRDAEPRRPVSPTTTYSPKPAPTPSAPAPTAPVPKAPPSEIPEV
ncbi:SCO2583/SCO2584 N-terminal domain-containing protein [Actinomadura chokoriensis]|uniref:Serine/threonine protein kinase n=1 Tax=Actinomadura chokoriensis TaxID=454156 RepID=A0ABV4QRP6_9ACTN